MGESDGTLVVLPYGGGSGDGGVENLPHVLPEVYSLLGGVHSRVVLSLVGGMRDACLLLGLVSDRPSAECEQVAGSKLACVAVIRPVGVGEACELEAVVGPHPPQTSGVGGGCL
jgi:hypothetical protein